MSKTAELTEQERITSDQILVIGALSEVIEQLGGEPRELVTEEQAERIVEIAEKYTSAKPDEEVIADITRILVEKITTLLAEGDVADAEG